MGKYSFPEVALHGLPASVVLMMTNDVAEQTLNFCIKFRSLLVLVVSTTINVTVVGWLV